MKKVLVIGACGQIGVELTLALRKKYGDLNVVAADIKEKPSALADGPFITLDVLDKAALRKTIEEAGYSDVYLLAALLSATGEHNPRYAWELNMESLRSVLELGVEFKFKIFWPSSIAIFGPTTPKKHTPQETIIQPETMYGITKFSGELLCRYYSERFGLDVRSVRYPGIVSFVGEPGGGTTDYAVEIFYEAIKHRTYECFLHENTYLPMMYMDDAIRATIELMEAPREKIKTRMAYNLSAMSFSPKELATEIQKHIPDFTISHKPDERQHIAESWPESIDDSVAREEWGWESTYDLEKMAASMLLNLQEKLK
jgi:nucleoside-diphosphate-sugar epimerase